jgi:hypothetical protein
MENVLERLGTTESTTLVVKREDDGKIRITSLLWPEPKVILKGEVLEIRNADGSLHLARKPRHHDDQDPLVEVLMTLVPVTAATDKVTEAKRVSR